jgi:hypothetical protein
VCEQQVQAVESLGDLVHVVQLVLFHILQDDPRGAEQFSALLPVEWQEPDVGGGEVLGEVLCVGAPLAEGYLGTEGEVFLDPYEHFVAEIFRVVDEAAEEKPIDLRLPLFIAGMGKDVLVHTLHARAYPLPVARDDLDSADPGLVGNPAGDDLQDQPLRPELAQHAAGQIIRTADEEVRGYL